MSTWIFNSMTASKSNSRNIVQMFFLIQESLTQSTIINLGRAEPIISTFAAVQEHQCPAQWMHTIVNNP
jgi:hypothetical protein